MTFAQLMAQLAQFDPDRALIFQADGQAIGGGYHVTELQHLVSTGIDCCGNIERWQEARFQLLDGAGKTHMPVGKFLGILDRSLSKLPELADVPLLVEYAPGNLGLRTMRPSEPEARGAAVLIALNDLSAICKPAQRMMENNKADGTICQV